MPPEAETKNASQNAQQTRAQEFSASSSLKAAEPQKCCAGGNCAECGKQQPKVDASAEMAVIEQQILSGDFDGFFADLASSRETVHNTVGLQAVSQSGDGSVVDIGKTTGALGTIPPSQSAARYYDVPSPLTGTQPAPAPTAERLFSIGSVPKQAAADGLSGSGSLRDSIPGVAQSGGYAAAPASPDKGLAGSREASQKVEREKAAPSVERPTSKEAVAPQAQQAQQARESERSVNSVASSSHPEQQAAKPSTTAAPRVDRQEVVRAVNVTQLSAARQSVSSPAATQSSAPQGRAFASSITSPMGTRSSTRQNSADVAPRAYESRLATDQPRMPRVAVDAGVARSSRIVKKTAAIGDLARDSQVTSLEKSRALIRTLEKVSNDLRSPVTLRGTAQSYRRITPTTRALERLVRNAEVAGVRSATQRRAVETLRAIARALAAPRSNRDNKVIGRVLATTLRRLSGAVEKRFARLQARGQAQARLTARAPARRAAFTARIRAIRAKLERISAKYQMKRGATRRSEMTRSRDGRNTRRRGQTKSPLSTNLQSKVTRKSPSRDLKDTRETKTSTRVRVKAKADTQRQELRELRREVKALRQSLQDIVPMIEMMKTLSSKRRSVRAEEELDLRGFISEKQLAALLKRKSLSSLERKKIERALTKKRKAKGAAGPVKSASTASKKQSGAGTKSSTKASQGKDTQQDAEMKSYAKTLSTFLMRTDDDTDGDDDVSASMTE